MMTVAPAIMVANRSNTDRSKKKGAWLEQRSSRVSPVSLTAHRTKKSEVRWLMVTPLGSPVEPEV